MNFWERLQAWWQRNVSDAANSADKEPVLTEDDDPFGVEPLYSPDRLGENAPARGEAIAQPQQPHVRDREPETAPETPDTDVEPEPVYFGERPPPNTELPIATEDLVRERAAQPLPDERKEQGDELPIAPEGLVRKRVGGHEFDGRGDPPDGKEEDALEQEEPPDELRPPQQARGLQGTSWGVDQAIGPLLSAGGSGNNDELAQALDGINNQNASMIEIQSRMADSLAAIEGKIGNIGRFGP